MVQKGGEGGARRSARNSGKSPDAADGDAQVSARQKDPVPAKKAEVAEGDSEEEVPARMEPAGNEGNKIDSSPPAYG